MLAFLPSSAPFPLHSLLHAPYAPPLGRKDQRSAHALPLGQCAGAGGTDGAR